MSDKLTRIAIVSTDKCKPKKCRQECKRSCPVVRMGKEIRFRIMFRKALHRSRQQFQDSVHF
jgi:translation initiation factor RLI1